MKNSMIGILDEERYSYAKISINSVFFFFSSVSNADDNTKILGVCFHPEKLNIDNSKIFELLKNIISFHIVQIIDGSMLKGRKIIYKVPNDSLDKLIKESNNNNITPLLILGYKNPLYSHDKPIDAATRSAFVNYVDWVVNRYKITMLHMRFIMNGGRKILRVII